MIKVDGKEIENFSSDTLEYDLGDVNYRNIFKNRR